MRRNVLRELLDNNKPSIGTHVHTLWPGMAEVIGYAGTIDYVEFTGTYAPHDLFSLENFGRAIDLFDNMSSMIKLDQQPRTYLAKKAVNSGIQNILYADVRSLEDAKECIAAMRPDTPESKGKQGVSLSRDMGYIYPGLTTADYVKNAEEGVVALMIEKKGAVEDLKSILSLKGIDMVQFGAGDYALNIGKYGTNNDEEVKEAELYTINTAIKMNIRPRVEISKWEEAEPYLELGVKDFSIGTDIVVVHEFCKNQGEKLSKLLNS